MNKVIVPAGYMGSGSSAITDLLSEMEGIETKNGSYEFIFLHCPNGMFDLEDKLLHGNNSLRSDEALDSFYTEMQCLYSKKNYWAGNYKRHISAQFIKYVDTFINQLCLTKFEDTYWYYTQKPINGRMQTWYYCNRLLKKISNGRIKTKMPVQRSLMRIAFPTATDFYTAAKTFITCVMNDLGMQDNNIVIDQLLLPHNLHRISNYFDDNLRVIVVERDPRDVFILNKYVWAPKKNAVPYPLDAKEFALYYKHMRMAERVQEDSRILRIYFEDLVYQYDHTVEKIIAFVGCNPDQHHKKKEMFDPSISIKNTQLFQLNDIYAQEISIIEKELTEYLYNFPEKNIMRDTIEGVF